MNTQTEWCGPAVEAFLDDTRVLNDWEKMAFQAYLALGYVDPNGERGIDIFLRTLRHALNDRQLEVLGYLKVAQVSLFEIQGVRLDVGLELEDVVYGRQVFVRERLATHSAVPGELILAWVTKVRDHHELVAGTTYVPPAHAELIVDTIDAELGKAAFDHPNTPVDALLPGIMPNVHRVLRKACEEFVPPKLLMDDGEEMMECRAVYQIADSATVRKQLSGHPDVRVVSTEEFAWIGSGNGREIDPQATITIRTVRLMLKALSRTRLAAGKRFLEVTLGEQIRHRTDRARDLATVFKSRSEVSEASGPAGRMLPGASAEAHGDSVAPRQSRASGEAEGRKKRRGDAHRLPLMAHEVMKKHVPGIDRLATRVANGVRKQWDESRTFFSEDIEKNKELFNFARDYSRTLVAREAVMSPEAATHEATLVMHHLSYMTNFELHRRRVFWVDESLAWLLTQTDLDVPGEFVRLPFPAFAIIFTDRATLELGESLLFDEESCSIRGEELRVLSVYITQGERTDNTQGIYLFFLFDALTGQWPYLVTRDLFVRPHDNLDEILDSHFPDTNVDALDPLFLAPELKKLLHLVVNCILYSTSAHLDPIILHPDNKRSGRKNGGRSKRSGGNFLGKSILSSRQDRDFAYSKVLALRVYTKRTGNHEALHGARPLAAGGCKLAGSTPALDRTILERT